MERARKNLDQFTFQMPSCNASPWKTLRSLRFSGITTEKKHTWCCYRLENVILYNQCWISMIVNTTCKEKQTPIGWAKHTIYHWKIVLIYFHSIITCLIFFCVIFVGRCSWRKKIVHSFGCSKMLGGYTSIKTLWGNNSQSGFARFQKHQQYVCIYQPFFVCFFPTFFGHTKTQVPGGSWVPVVPFFVAPCAVALPIKNQVHPMKWFREKALDSIECIPVMSETSNVRKNLMTDPSIHGTGIYLYIWLIFMVYIWSSYGWFSWLPEKIHNQSHGCVSWKLVKRPNAGQPQEGGFIDPAPSINPLFKPHLFKAIYIPIGSMGRLYIYPHENHKKINQM